MQSVVILANGEFPTHEAALSYLCGVTDVVCCDGAYEKLLQSNISLERKKIVVIGDGDSSSEAVRSRADLFVHVSEQETNDLTKATRYCIKQGYTSLVYLGATGLREDHTLGNISLLLDYLAQYNCEVRMITNYGVFTPINLPTTFPSFYGQQVSIFTLDPTAPISSEGLEYPLNNRCLTNLWQGTLNMALGSQFEIITQSPLLVYQTHEPK